MSFIRNAGGGAYTNATPVPTAVGGVEAGSTFSNVPLTDMWDDLLYPYQSPAFTSFSISGQSTLLEVGAELAAGDKLFTWSTSNSGNIEPASLDIKDITGALDLVIGTTDDGSETTYIDAIAKSTAASHTWRISAVNTNANTFTRDFKVNWYWKVYYGESPLTALTETDIEALRMGELKSNSANVYTLLGGDYKWLCYPTAMGLKATFIDVNTGFPIAMEPATIVSVTNLYGITTDYYTHRTTNTLGSGITVGVS